MNDNYNDLMSAMQKLYRWGFNGQMGDRMAGLQELLDRLRARRQAEMNRYNLDSVMQDIREKLDQMVQQERKGLQKRLEDTEQRQKKLRKMLEKQVKKKQQYLDKLPQDPGQQMPT